MITRFYPDTQKVRQRAANLTTRFPIHFQRQIIREYGYGFMFPIGKTTTQHEEMVRNTMHGIENA
jgi:hypothetical protein